MSELEERVVARRWRDCGDVQARNLLVQSQLQFVQFIARKYQRAGVSLGELIAEGNYGLLRAAERFNPELGYRFVTYAKYWVRVHISQCVVRNSSSGFHDSRALRKARREYARATTLVGDGMAARKLMAERLQLNPEQTDALLGLVEQRQVSFESLGAEHGATVEDPLYSKEPSPEQATAAKCDAHLLRAAVRDALTALDPRERLIVDRRLMVDEEAMLTLKELGKALGVSRERVRQLESRLKKKLAAKLQRVVESGESPAQQNAA